MTLDITKSRNYLLIVAAVSLFVAILVLSEYAMVAQTSALTSSGGDWTSFTLDSNDSRYQASSTITSSNVGSLKEAWFFPANHSVTSTPVVQNGHVYFSDWRGNVYSLNIANGLDDGPGNWDSNITRLLDLGSPFAISSTPDLSNGLVYVAGSPLYSTQANRTMLVALYQSNGQIAWSRVLRNGPGGIYSSPIDFNGLVYVGESDCHERFPNRTLIPGCSEFAKSNVGEVFAVNAMTGQSVWNFTTGNTLSGGGWGAGVWGSVVVDPSLNSIYFGTGNSFQNTSSSCSTCSGYAYSIVSLDATTGSRIWSYQVYKNWMAAQSATFGDDDFGSTPNLFSIMKNGVPHEAIGLMIKSGTYYILDRVNGASLYNVSVQDSSGANVGVGGFIYPSGTVNPEIFLPAGSGGVQAFAPSDSASPLWTVRTSGIMDGSEVALVPGAVLVGDGGGNLYAFNMSNGKTLLSEKLPNLPSGYGVYGGVSVAEGFVLVGDYDYVLKESSSADSGGVYAFSLPSTGTTTTSSSTGSTSSSSYAISTSASSTSSSASNPSSSPSTTTTPSAPPPTTSRTSPSGGQPSFPINTALIIGAVVVAVVIVGATLFLRRRS